MLSPKKYIDLDKSVLMVAGIILKYMLTNKVVKVNILLSFVESKVNDEIHKTFLIALTMLYSLGKVDYFDKNDTLSLVN